VRLKIWHKLFVAILLVIALILGINLVLSQVIFQRGFTQYVEAVKEKRLEGFRTIIAETYREEGGWAWLEAEPWRWRQLLQQAEVVPPRPFRRGMGPRRGGPPSVGFPSLDHRPSPPGGRIGLLDYEQIPLIGPPGNSQHHQLQPIESEGGVVGYLTIPRFDPFRSQIDHRFADQQRKSLLITALISLVIAVIAALFLARQFNRPISRLAKMARQLTAGGFENRVILKSRDELGALATDLNQLAETLELNRRSRQQWIADISHELRTPLTVLRGELEALEDGVRPFGVDALQSLSTEVEQLKRLVDDLYQLSLSDQGALSYEKAAVDPLQLLQGVIESLQPSIEQQGLTLEFHCGRQKVMLLADPQRLIQLYTNLLENSLRYTDTGGVIRVRCEVSDTLSIHFEDSAPGVSDQQLPKMFERLFRVDPSRSRRHGGSGLGLSIARAIVTAHDGEIDAEPSPLGGIRITLQLPIEQKG